MIKEINKLKKKFSQERPLQIELGIQTDEMGNESQTEFERRSDLYDDDLKNSVY